MFSTTIHDYAPSVLVWLSFLVSSVFHCLLESDDLSAYFDSRLFLVKELGL